MKYRRRTLAEARRVPYIRNYPNIAKFVDECLKISDWCGGTSYMMVDGGEAAYTGAPIPGPHIQVGITHARPGDWIVRQDSGVFNVYSDARFQAIFEAIEPSLAETLNMGTQITDIIEPAPSHLLTDLNTLAAGLAKLTADEVKVIVKALGSLDS